MMVNTAVTAKMALKVISQNGDRQVIIRCLRVVDETILKETLHHI